MSSDRYASCSETLLPEKGCKAGVPPRSTSRRAGRSFALSEGRLWIPDSGAATAGESGVGPKIGCNFGVNGLPTDTNQRSFHELDVQNRSEGGGLFLVANIPVTALAQEGQ